jgi:hypothetical protein
VHPEVHPDFQAELDEDVRDDFCPDAPDISHLARSIFDLMCSSTASDPFPQNQRPLFIVIAEILHRQIEERLPEFVSVICARFNEDIDRIVAEQRRIESQREHLEKAREAKTRTLQERTERQMRAGVPPNEILHEAAESACARETCSSHGNHWYISGRRF